MRSSLPVLLAALLLSSPLRADVAPDPVAMASGVSPTDKEAAKDIALRSEEVIIDVYDRFAIVDATFELVNAGAATELEAGFPGERTRAGNGHTEHRALVGFTAWVDGKQVTAEAKGVKRSAGRKSWTETWHVFRLSFAEGSTLKVRVRYGVAADHHREDPTIYTAGSNIDHAVWYILATGAGWKGPIGEAVVRIRARGDVDAATLRVRDDGMPGIPETSDPGVEVTPVLPAYGSRKDGEIVLVRKDFEPSADDDLQVIFRPVGIAGDKPVLILDESDPVVKKAIEEALAK